MKTNIVIISLLLSGIFFNQSSSQTLTEEEKQQVLRDLQYDGFLDLDSTWLRVGEALSQARQYKIVEAIPIIRSGIWSCEQARQREMMYALYELNDPDIIGITKAIIDSAESILAGTPRKHPHYMVDPKDMRNDAILQLFNLGDFTYTDKFVQYVREKGGLNVPGNRGSIFRMGNFIKAVPAYRDFIKSELVKVMEEDTSKNATWRGAAAIQMVLAIEYCLPELIAFFENTNDNSGTNSYIADQIAALKYPPFENALKSKLTSGQELKRHDEYIRCLLKYYGSPGNYQFVVTYAVNQQSEWEKKEALFALKRYIPDTPSVNISISTLIDSLYSYIQQSQNFRWIGDKNFVKELTNHLDNAKKHLNKQDSTNCKKEVEKFQEKVDKEYKETIEKEKKHEKREKKFVTVEGWKFLYYNAQYILDRLPAIKKEEEEEED